MNDSRKQDGADNGVGSTGGSAIPRATADEAAHGWQISGSVISALCDEVNSHRDKTLGLDDETAELVVLTLEKMGYVQLSPNSRDQGRAESAQP